MRLRSLLIVFPLLTLCLASCGESPVLDETRPFDGGIWNRFKPEVFDVNIEKPDDFYNITVELVVDSALMRGNSFPLTVNLYSPDNEHRMFYTGLLLRNGDRWKGESAGEGLRVVKQNIREYFSFRGKGTHRLEIGQATSQYDLEGVRSMHVTIAKAEIDYDDL